MSAKRKAVKPKTATVRLAWQQAQPSEAAADAIKHMADMLHLTIWKKDSRDLEIVRLILADKKLEAITLLLKPPDAPKSHGVWKIADEPGRSTNL